MFDFANILFGGRCNARCYFCIGRQLDPQLKVDNLDHFPPRKLDRLLALVRQHRIRQVVLTGANTDPQLYRHEAQLLAYLRAALPAGTQLSLHTNGRLALRKMELFNAYDRVALSIPSFHPDTYRRMMGVANAPELALILQRAAVPVKLSCLVTKHNVNEMESFLADCRRMGVRRVVLRKLFGDQRPWEQLSALDKLGLEFCGRYRDNPVYDYHGMQVTLWDFGRSQSRSLNLFSSGLISDAYLLLDAGASSLDANPQKAKKAPLAYLEHLSAARFDHQGHV